MTDPESLLSSVATPPASIVSCEQRPLERLRFWDGRFLVARDMRDQQASLILRSVYHQRYSHGTGVLCGFGVSEHPRPECRDRWVVVEPGMAYDCCGRTLLLTERRVAEFRKSASTSNGTEAFLIARFKDRLVDPVPSLNADDPGNPLRSEFGRIREDVEFDVVGPEKVSHACWPRSKAVTADDLIDPVSDDCDEAVSRAPQTCSESCACGSGVILARLLRPEGATEIRIETTHPLDIAPPQSLTRIDGINWPHGGDVPLEELGAAEPTGMNGQLIVRFSRPLKLPDGESRGINARTFTVSYLTQTGNMEFILPPDPEDLPPGGLVTPRLSPNRRCAVFDIPNGLLKGRTSIRNSTVFIAIRGDFLEDCHGRAVSCAHIRGDVAARGTGNRKEGGLFESWFYVS